MMPDLTSSDAAVQPDTQAVTKLCLLAGKIIMQSGGETQRVEDTMMRIAAAYGHHNSHSFVTPTGILFAIDGSSHVTRLVRISNRSNNLKKVAIVNDISRKVASSELDYHEALQQLQHVDKAQLDYPSWLTTLAAAVASACFLYMSGGTWYELAPVFIIGGIGYSCFNLLHDSIKIKFFAEFIAALLIGTLAVAVVHMRLASQLDTIIIGSVIPLVPGLHITNAIRDLMAGHLVSGISKGAEAFLTASAIGAGIAAVLFVF